MVGPAQPPRAAPAGPSAGGPPGPGVLGALAFAAEAADEVVLGTVRDVHGAVAGRAHRLVNRATGGAAYPSQLLHDGIARTVYAGVELGLRTGARALRAGDRHGLGPRLDAFARGSSVRAVVNGLVGDRLAETRSDLAITMALRHAGRDLPPTRPGLARAYPDASAALVVFVPGLGESEHVWDRGAGAGGGSYGDRLAAELGWSPVFVRANTGLPIAENGVGLDRLLERLVAHWPVPVRRLVLVGHSMGGLVVRAGCAHAGPDDRRADPHWTDLVTDVVTLGTPHLGAPLERGAAIAARGLGRLPESAPFGRVLEYRSVGILDLRAGLAADVRALPHARYHLVAATLCESPRHPVSAALGDLLVRVPSALGRPRGGPPMFPGADTLHVRGGHFALLNHPEVYAALRRWLGPAQSPVPGRTAAAAAEGPHPTVRGAAESADGEQRGIARGTVGSSG